ncbi:EAL domain, c-di-GMP-specific phosphodiesterase class I (or its enzymatically inactive variant) [Pseudoxanthomonas sp. GM95]|uniref:putative bifunctional diguanylate cyclase/phosphodiesterase n=1 Tax=Pseudoxanthomonas sp. GM95 TaxID=1881043 RepID=UPI0008B8E046|nr:bifunctional diguanylate cyclase/phosphodiesterase [Pseudoxanthomonas sp. GM95]SEK66544.1 EAL domain, c-di-GMP-specific phosphodiesterase class I (or its enzymatically inactive variant) [Pseudoxanthomonas sp. GM95]
MLNRDVVFEAIARLMPPAQPQGALLVVRMQRMREFEAVFGYQASDALVSAFDERLHGCLRGVDEAVRIGECDYAVVLPGLRDANHATLAAAKVSRAFQSPLDAGGRPSRVVVSVGVAMSGAEVSPEALCLNADAACAQAQRQPERHAVFNGQAQVSIGYEDLHHAITSNRLQVYLQPLFALESGTLCGYESLARWHDPRLGFVRPDLFVTAAEQTGLIDGLTRWSINATLRHCAPVFKAHPHLHCGINISPIALTAAGFVDQMSAALRIWDVRPEQVMLEVTETAFVDNPQLIGQALTRLREMGMKIAVDDFGTGYSSLSYFRHFHVDELKIDISFVRDMMHSPRVCRLVESIINMAHSLEAVTVAEGIEDSAVWNKLRELGCDIGQGYYPGRPAPADEALAQFSAT